MARLEQRFKAMGGPGRICIDHSDESLSRVAAEAALAEIQRLETRYSRYRSDSLLSRINRCAGSEAVPIDGETAALLQYADTLWQQSDGKFDPTSGVLRHAWDFKSNELPTQEAIDALLGKIGWQMVQWNETEAYLPQAGMELDLGGCVKEYAVDAAAAILRNHGVVHALVDLAGDIATCGPQRSGAPWSIGIRNPGSKTDALAYLELSGQSLASSGDYERYMEINGQRYAHILNPHSGWPISGLRAVSVSAPQCLVAGSSATLAMLKPEVEALEWLAQLGLPWLAVDQKGDLYSAEHRFDPL